ncbi:DJ-1/PfpI family protein [Verticillium alfalfae VaMs.102]|uniref:DJ-1/PfpI family protein n=1 Tax=Verticillium alfalfae (strain VaMs.102 / ATCC MYA-4576 / FGSC 10136) TaxID=526221 RepID=C9SPD2_VERA1|nr:DJ-1/PfpI family protein [Verticillium alfalfae VaMs.102]EEY20647.1 DJ-1/PfpI family protein [Verticillium alfalfae VaMs.102]
MVTTTIPKKSLRIGVMMEAVQLADITGIDILGNLSRTHYEGGLAIDNEFAKFEQDAVDMTFYYIGSTLEPTGTSPSLMYLPNVTYDTCPRDLDIIIIGGPLPSHRPPPADRFMKEAWLTTRVWLTTCIGSMWLASTGLLDGKKATTNRSLLGAAKQAHPDVEWLDQKWVITDKAYEGPNGKGELWTAGGAAVGTEMIAKYCLQNFNPEYVQYVALHSLALDEYELEPFYRTKAVATQ